MPAMPGAVRPISPQPLPRLSWPLGKKVVQHVDDEQHRVLTLSPETQTQPQGLGSFAISLYFQHSKFST
jgi:hypothetical protein